MSRKSICDIPDEFIHSSGSLVNKVFDFELLTPMFGGDAESWEIDIKNPVRSQAVKGQLRFWWRTMQSETDHEKLLYSENKIWGGKTGTNDQENNRCQSRVKLSVIKQKSNDGIFQAKEKNNKFIGVEDDIIPSYVLFPITDKVKDNKQIAYIDSLTFKLQIAYPADLEDDVLNTLKLWCLFGGVGARTRRGTGSLYCEELLNDFKSENDIKAFMDSFKDDTENEELLYPRIIDAIFAVKKEIGNDPSSIWHGMLTRYGDYRQKAGVGRGRGDGNRPGRSYWPEPDSIRELSQNNAPHHQPEHPDRNWFPRSAFGLPIQFEFRGEATDPQGKITLEPNIGTGERWTSPVILKVIKLPNGNIYKTALVFNQKFPESLQLKSNRGLNHTLTENELPINRNGKVLKTNNHLNDRTIYEHLIDFLHLEEVK